MQVKINVRYNTASGERICLLVGGKYWEMEAVVNGLWQVEMPSSAFSKTHIFTFCVMEGDRETRREWGRHTLRLSRDADMEIRSRWIDRPEDAPFYSQAFRDVIQGRRRDPEQKPEGNLVFCIPAVGVRPEHALAIAGTKGKTLKGWDKPMVMSDALFPNWSIDLEAKDVFEYKFLIVDRKTKAPVAWEEGPNHLFAEIPPKGMQLVLASEAPVIRQTPWRGAGTAIPVFSLRTEDSFGVGDFHDLKKMADWVASTGQNIIQLLPINDTTMTGTWTDSYPYNANSSFALHPQFLYLPALGIKETAAYKKEKAALEALPQVDYEKVNQAKIRLARKAFDKGGEAVLESAAFKAFADANAYWLNPYAAYCVLRDKTGKADFAEWGEFSVYSKKRVEEFVRENEADYDFYRYLQFNLDAQLHEAVAYVHSKGVAIKGDLPIGVSRTSCDAWTNPRLFHMDSQAGAPPDAFATDGQNWGFPTYNWEEMAKDGYLWWRRRLGKMSEYFDAYRIDHILGFFRIWEIPIPHKSGLMGHFSPALPYSGKELEKHGFNPLDETLFLEDPRKKGFYHPRIDGKGSEEYNRLHDDFFYHRNDAKWQDEAMKKLPALIDSTGMLACGEDLGMIPACVPETMARLRLLSLEIQRMPKDPRVLFAKPAAYPYHSVCATGTHDMAPLRAWWEEDRALSSKFYHEELGMEGDAPYFCEPWLCRQIIAQHMASPSMLAILPLQDWLSVDGEVRYPGHPADERINVPAISRYYWRYRMHVTLESLIGNKALTGEIKSLVAAGGRG